MTDQFLPHILMGHIASVGMTGAGKTSSSKLVVEQDFRAGHHICIVDPIKSDWWGLISNAAGDGPGLPFNILGGPHGHVPLHPGDGAKIARLVASGALRYSIIDTRKFPMGGLQRFWNDFAPVLLDELNVVLRLVLEEAHELAPKEKSGVGGESMGVYHAKRMATAGRSAGLRLLVNTQRVQALHNAVLGSCSTVLVHRMNLPADREPVTKWLNGSIADATKRMEIERSIPNLATGEAWVCSVLEGGFIERMQLPRISTYDNSAAPTAHGRRNAHVVAAPIDLAKLTELIGEQVEEEIPTGEKALRAEVKKLREEVKHLTTSLQVAKQAATVVDQDELYRGAYKAGEQYGFGKGRSDGFKEARDIAIQQAAEFLRRAAGELMDKAGRLDSSIKLPVPPADQWPKPVLEEPYTGKTLVVPIIPPAAPRAAAPATPGVQMKKAERMVLTALAQYPAGRSKAQVAILSGYAINGGGFNNALGAGRTNGWIEGFDHMTITPAGRAALGEFKPLPHGFELLTHWRGQLKKAEDLILRNLVDAYPSAVSKEKLAKLCSYAPDGGGFNNALGRLRTLELITGYGELKAAAELFG